MDSNKKVIVIIVAIVAVGLAVVMGVRAFTGQGRVDTAETQTAIQQATQTHVDQSMAGEVATQSNQAPQATMRLPGNKGGAR